MKKIFIAAFMLLAFSTAVNAQESKEKNTKTSCCATKDKSVADASSCGDKEEAKNKATVSACSSGTAPSEGTSEAKAVKSESADSTKKACKTDGTCCGSKNAAKT